MNSDWHEQIKKCQVIQLVGGVDYKSYTIYLDQRRKQSKTLGLDTKLIVLNTGCPLTVRTSHVISSGDMPFRLVTLALFLLFPVSTAAAYATRFLNKENYEKCAIPFQMVTHPGFQRTNTTSPREPLDMFTKFQPNHLVNCCRMSYRCYLRYYYA